MLPEELRPERGAVLAATTEFTHVGGMQVIALPVAGAPWRVLYTVPKRDLTWLVAPRLLPYLVLLGVVLLAFLLVCWLFIRRFLHPAARLLEAAQDPAVESGRLLEVAGPWRPWAETLARDREISHRYVRELEDSNRLTDAIVNSALDSSYNFV